MDDAWKLMSPLSEGSDLEKRMKNPWVCPLGDDNEIDNVCDKKRLVALFSLWDGPTLLRIMSKLKW